jgi:hypothetical protein
MITKAEKIFFSVAIALVLGIAIFWGDLQTLLRGDGQPAAVKVSGKQTKEGEGKNKGKQDVAISDQLQYWQLASDLKEISGLVAVEDGLWAVSDNPKKPVMKLDQQGTIVQELTLQGFQIEDAEALASDGRYIYVGDVGDNKGDREERKIYRVEVASIEKGQSVTARADVITFSFEGQTIAGKKKENEFDCEAMFFHNGSLYLFTKRRTDKDTEVFCLSAAPGKQVAKSLGTFETSGMITGASINAAGTEVALTGYYKGHRYPFLLLLKNFSGDAFFGGTRERIELASDKRDWQVESITYAGDDVLYFANEDTRDVPAALYRIKRQDLPAIHQER